MSHHCEDDLWTQESQTEEIIKRLRKLPDPERTRLSVDVGLLDSIEQSSQAG